MQVLKTIGVLGGMGPQATVLLQQRLIAGVEAEDDAWHVPLLIDMNPQVPSRLEWILEGKGQDPGVVLAAMASRLQQAGASALVMPCNTAHHFADQIMAAVGIPFIDMVSLSAQKASRSVRASAPIGILASPATQQIGLFRDALGTLGHEAVYPSGMDELLACIRRIKSRGASEQDQHVLISARDECARLGCESVLVGCSEFSLVADALHGQLPVIDTLDVLVDAMLDFSGVKALTAVN